MVCIFQSYGVWALCTRVGGVVINTNWPIGCFSMSLVAALFVALAYMSTVFRCVTHPGWFGALCKMHTSLPKRAVTAARTLTLCSAMYTYCNAGQSACCCRA